MRSPSQTSFSTGSATVESERRRCPRSKLSEIVYVALGASNGGIVLDVSERGLSFHAAAPVENNNVVSVRFATQSLSGIEVLGTVTWKDASGKSGGLYFPRAPEKVHEELLRWQGRLPRQKNWEDVSQTETTAVTKTTTAPRHRLASLILLAISAILGFNCSTIFRAYNYVQSGTALAVQESLQNARGIAQSLMFQNAESLREKQELLATLASVTPAHDLSFEDALQNPLITEGADFVVLSDSGHAISFYTADRGLQDTELQRMAADFFLGRKRDRWWLGNNQLYQVVSESVDSPENSGQSSRVIALGRRFGYKQLYNLSDVLATDIAIVHGKQLVETTLRPLEEAALQEMLTKSCCEVSLRIGEKRFNTTSLDLGQRAEDMHLLILKSVAPASPAQRRLHQLFWMDAVFTMIGFVVGVFLWFI